jgi:excisionase family DNA binding protein
MDEKQYTTTEAAQALGLHERTVIRYIRRGVLAGARLRYGSRRLGYRIPASSIEYVRRGGIDEVQDRVPA